MRTKRMKKRAALPAEAGADMVTMMDMAIETESEALTRRTIGRKATGKKILAHCAAEREE